MFGESSGESRGNNVRGGVASTTSSPQSVTNNNNNESSHAVVSAQHLKACCMPSDDIAANQNFDTIHHNNSRKRPLVLLLHHHHGRRRCNSLDSGSIVSTTKSWEEDVEELVRQGQTVRRMTTTSPRTARTSALFSQSLNSHSMDESCCVLFEQQNKAKNTDPLDVVGRPAEARQQILYGRSFSTSIGAVCPSGSWDMDHYHHHQHTLLLPRLDHHSIQGGEGEGAHDPHAQRQQQQEKTFDCVLLARASPSCAKKHSSTCTTQTAANSVGNNEIFRVRGGGDGGGSSSGGSATHRDDNNNDNGEDHQKAAVAVPVLGGKEVDDDDGAADQSSKNVILRFPLMMALERALRQELHFNNTGTSSHLEDADDDACSAVATIPTNTTQSKSTPATAASGLSLKEWIRTSGIFSGGGGGELDVPPLVASREHKNDFAVKEKQKILDEEDTTSVTYDDEEDEASAWSNLSPSSDPINVLTSMLLTSTFPSFAFGMGGGGFNNTKNKASSSSTSGYRSDQQSSTLALVEDREPCEESSHAAGGDEDVPDTSSITVASSTGEEKPTTGEKENKDSASSSSSTGNAHDRQEKHERTRRPVVMQRTTGCLVYKGEGFEVANWETPLVRLTPSSLQSLNTNVDVQKNSSSSRRHSSNGSSCSSRSSQDENKPDAFDRLMAKLPNEDNQHQDCNNKNSNDVLPLLQSINTDVMSHSSSSSRGSCVSDDGMPDAFDRLVAAPLSQEQQQDKKPVVLPSLLQTVNTATKVVRRRRRDHFSSSLSNMSSPVSDEGSKPDAFDRLVAKLPNENERSNVLPSSLSLQSVNTNIKSYTTSSSSPSNMSSPVSDIWNKPEDFDRLVAKLTPTNNNDKAVILQSVKAEDITSHTSSSSNSCSPVSNDGSKPDAFDRLVSTLPNEKDEDKALPSSLLQPVVMNHSSHSSLLGDGSSKPDAFGRLVAKLPIEKDDGDGKSTIPSTDTKNVTRRSCHSTSFNRSSPISDDGSKPDAFDRLLAKLPNENDEDVVLPSLQPPVNTDAVMSQSSQSSISEDGSSKPDAFDRLVAKLPVGKDHAANTTNVARRSHSLPSSNSSSPISDDGSKPDAFDRFLAKLPNEEEDQGKVQQSVNTDIMSHTSSSSCSPVSEDGSKPDKEGNGQDKILQSVNTELMSHSSHSSISEDGSKPDAFDLLVAPLWNQDKEVMSAQDNNDHDDDNDDCSQVSIADSIDDIRRYEQAQQQKEQSTMRTGIFGWWSSVRSLPEDQESDEGSVWDMGEDTHDDTNFRDPWLVDEYESEYADFGKSAQPYPILGIPTTPTADANNDESRSSSHSNGQVQLVLSRPLMESLRPFLPWSKRSENYWLKYSMGRDGASMHTFLHQARGAKYSFLAIETIDGEVFGSFTAEPWRKNWNYFGSGESFLWRMQGKRQAGTLSESELEQRESKVEVFPFSYQNDCIQLCTQNSIAVGAGSNVRPNFSSLEESVPSSESATAATKEGVPSPPASPTVKAHQWGFGLMIQDDLLHGTSSPCLTFGSPPLSIEHSDGSLFEILHLDLWTLTPCMQLEEAQKMELRKLLIEEEGVLSIKI